MRPQILSRFNGIFAVIKPKGITSASLLEKIYADLISELKNTSNLKTNDNGRHGMKLFKMGHGGTLDMEASGVLTVGIGRGCSCLPAFLSGEKRYLTKGRLGIETDSLNASGTIVNQSPYEHVTEESLRKAMLSFEGEIEQVPPIYSALKRGGQRLSDLARAGQEVMPKPPRKVKVYHLECTDFNPPYFSIDITCGGGFYVRKLIQDLGKAVDCCAHMVDLERTQHGPFTKSMAIPTNHWTVSAVLEAVQQNRDILQDFITNAVTKHKENNYIRPQQTRKRR